MKQCLIRYSEAKNYINEGDVLLFRGNGLLSLLIQGVGEGYYSHVGMTTWDYDKDGKKSTLQCIEFREWIGSRILHLGNYVEENPGIIDVFRAIPQYVTYTYNCKMRQEEINIINYDGQKLTDEFKTLTGLPYGWYRILWLAQFHLLGFRFFNWQSATDDTVQKHEYYPVCSTIVAHLFAKHYTKLVRFRSSSRTEPSDVARSPILNYMFTLVP